MKARAKRPNPISATRRRHLAIYTKLKRAFLEAHWRCLACYGHRNAQDVHHARGRISTLLIDRRFWLPVCRTCHNWIQEHPSKARELGLLVELGKWNSPPRDKETAWLKEVLAGREGRPW